MRLLGFGVPPPFVFDSLPWNFTSPQAAITSVAATAFAVPTGGLSLVYASEQNANLEAEAKMKDSQKKLDKQRSDELTGEAGQRAAAAAAAASRGLNFGGGGEYGSLATGLGFGTAPRSSANAGRGQITGMI